MQSKRSRWRGPKERSLPSGRRTAGSSVSSPRGSWPRFLPDGRHFLFFARSRQRENRAIYVGSLDSKMTRRLMPADSNAVFARPGYLLFLREGTLVALPFSEKRLQWTGEPIRIAERVRGSDGQYAASFDASEAGVLVYGSGSTANQQLAWFSRDGKRLGSAGPGGSYLDLTLSPDQKRVALAYDYGRPELDGGAQEDKDLQGLAGVTYFPKPGKGRRLVPTRGRRARSRPAQRRRESLRWAGRRAPPAP
jgi:hypothetical protein